MLIPSTCARSTGARVLCRMKPRLAIPIPLPIVHTGQDSAPFDTATSRHINTESARPIWRRLWYRPSVHSHRQFFEVMETANR